ncbi:hypothetical protein GCM10020331_066850 [Ectobacillus funiculus]
MYLMKGIWWNMQRKKALTYRLKQSMMEELLSRLLQNDIREEFAQLIEDTIWQSEQFFFYAVKDAAREVPGSDRLEIAITNEVRKRGRKALSKSAGNWRCARLRE